MYTVYRYACTKTVELVKCPKYSYLLAARNPRPGKPMSRAVEGIFYPRLTSPAEWSAGRFTGSKRAEVAGRFRGI